MRTITAILIAVFLVLPSIASALPRYECAEHQTVHLRPCPHEQAHGDKAAASQGEGTAEHAGCADHPPTDQAEKTSAKEMAANAKGPHDAHGTSDDRCCVLTADELPSDPFLKASAVSLRGDAGSDGLAPITTLTTLPRQMAAACAYESTGPPRGDPVPLFLQHCAFLI